MRSENSALTESLPAAATSTISTSSINSSISEVSLVSNAVSTEYDYHDLFPALDDEDLGGTVFHHVLDIDQQSKNEQSSRHDCRCTLL